MNFRIETVGVLVVGLLVGATFAFGDARETYMQWAIHDPARPTPVIVTPGQPSTQEQPGTAPSDAVVLFDGTSTEAFLHGNGSACRWMILEDGSLEVVTTPGAPHSDGDLYTKQAFGDMQLHLEWMVAQDLPRREGQGNGNSGVYMMGLYEVQILDCYENASYADGMVASVYGQTPALANACHPRGKWQVYDIIFRRPHFDANGNCVRPAVVTVFHNGVLVQDHTEIFGPTVHGTRATYHAHPEAQPFRLQDHGDKMRFRNIWVRELPEID